MGFRALLVMILVVGIVVGSVLAWTRSESSAPILEAPEQLLLGKAAQEVTITLREEGMGLKRINARLVQGERETSLHTQAISGTWLWGNDEHEREIVLRIDPESQDLVDGAARLLISAEDWSWRSNLSELEIPIEIDHVPPSLTVRSGLTYVDPGGAAVVVYELSEAAARDGVEVEGANGTFFYPGYPFPSAGSQEAAAGRRVAIFAIERDAGPTPSISVVAVDRVENATRARWNVVVQPRVFPRGNVNLPGSFLRNVVPDLARAGGISLEDPAAAFHLVNTEMRQDNERKIREQLVESASFPLWEGAFGQLPNSKVTSRFAEARTYLVDGRAISNAIHYGYDLASLSGAAITAANAGRVRYAGDLGIYGNCVLVDHGLGVASLYGHLSRIDVSVGDDVTKGQRLGLSGATGLAGGDHLHFAILVGPTYVDPLEWWDPKWVREHVEVRLDP